MSGSPKAKKRTDTFTYTVRDQFGYTDTADRRDHNQGVNDAPEITAGPVCRAVTEESDPDGAAGAGSFSGDVLSGELAFTDVDTSDTGHTYQVISFVETPMGGAPGHPALTSAQLEALLSLAGSSDEGATGTDGTIAWTFNGTEDQFDYLALGESVKLVYTVQVTDQHWRHQQPSNDHYHNQRRQRRWLQRRSRDSCGAGVDLGDGIVGDGG